MVVVPTDHLLSAVDEVTAADLDGEPILLPLDDVVAWAGAPGVQVDHRPETTKDAIELVAAGIGALIVPQSLARLHHRKDLAYRPIADAPTCPVALAVPDGAAAGTGRGVHRNRAGPQTRFVARAGRAGAETHRTGEDPREAGRPRRRGQGRPQAGPGRARSTLTLANIVSSVLDRRTGRNARARRQLNPTARPARSRRPLSNASSLVMATNFPWPCVFEPR